MWVTFFRSRIVSALADGAVAQFSTTVAMSNTTFAATAVKKRDVGNFTALFARNSPPASPPPRTRYRRRLPCDMGQSTRSGPPGTRDQDVMALDNNAMDDVRDWQCGAATTAAFGTPD